MYHRARREVELDLVLESPPNIPAGHATLAILHGESLLAFRSLDTVNAPQVTSAPVPIPTQSAGPMRVSVQLPQTDEDTITLQTVFFYRNHVLDTRQLDVRTAILSQLAKWQPPKQSEATVLVEGAYKDPGTACFILDCSKSMQNGPLNTAISAAKRVLPDLVEYLELRENRGRLSLWLFGQRIDDYSRAWNPLSMSRTPDGRLVTQSLRPPGDQTDISTDVALIWRKGDAFGLNDLLNPERLKATGQTPLHYAMIRVIEEELLDAPEPLRLVVLTDGVDSSEQIFIPENQARGVNAEKPLTVRTAQQVRKALEKIAGEKPQVFLLYDKKIDNDPQNLGRLRNLEKEVDGTLVPIGLSEADLDNLECQLNLAFGNFKWEMFPLPDAPQVEFPKRVGDAAVISQRGSYDVALKCLAKEAVRIEIRGGEAIVLWVEEKPRTTPRLIHKPYTEPKRSQPEFVIATNPGARENPDRDFQPEQLSIAGHRTETSGQDFTLRVSVQNADSTRFSPRPRWIWAEVQLLRPVGNRSEPVGAPVLVTDTDFEVGLPVPMLRLQTGPWPEPLTRDHRALLRLWFSLSETNPSGEKRLEEIEKLSDEQFVAIPDMQPVTYGARFQSLPSGVREVIITEKHPGEFDIKDARRVELSRQAIQVTREYYPNVGLIKHVFRFENVTEDELRKASLRVYLADDLKADANAIECPVLEIPVGR